MWNFSKVVVLAEQPTHATKLCPKEDIVDTFDNLWKIAVARNESARVGTHERTVSRDVRTYITTHEKELKERLGAGEKAATIYEEIWNLLS